MEHKNHTIYIPFKDLPDSKYWAIGRPYRVKTILKQIGMDSNGATFEVIKAISQETKLKSKRYFNEKHSYND